MALWINERHFGVVGFFIGLNLVDIDLDSMNHPQISHTQGLISKNFHIATESIIHCHLFQHTFKPPPSVYTV